MSTTTNATFWDVKPADYHADRTRERFSSLKDFAHNPALYHRRWVKGEQREDTEAFRIGTALHVALNEPERWDELYLVYPKVNRSTKEGKALYAEAVEQANGRILLNSEEMATIQGMIEGVRENPMARRLFDSLVHFEKPVIWEREHPLKVLCDGLGECIVDIKTTADAQEFGRSMLKYRYHCQAALYIEGVSLLQGPTPHYILAIEKTPPYESVVYQVSQRAIDAGRYWLDRTMRELSVAKALDVWHSPRTGQVIELDLPYWHKEFEDDE